MRRSCIRLAAMHAAVFLLLMMGHRLDGAYGQSDSTKQRSKESQADSPPRNTERAQHAQDSARLRDLRQAIRQNPNDPDLYYEAGVIEERLERWEEALRDYQATIRLNPRSVEAYYHAGLVSERLGETYYMGKSRVIKGPNRRYAISSYEAAVRLKPDFADAYYRLSLVYLLDGNLRRASETCQQLCRLEPDSERTRQLVQKVYDEYQARGKKH